MAVATAAAEGTTLGLVEVVARLRGLPTTAEAMAGLRARSELTGTPGSLDHFTDTGWAARGPASPDSEDLATAEAVAAPPRAAQAPVAALEATGWCGSLAMVPASGSRSGATVLRASS